MKAKVGYFDNETFTVTELFEVSLDDLSGMAVLTPAATPDAKSVVKGLETDGLTLQWPGQDKWEVLLPEDGERFIVGLEFEYSRARYFNFTWVSGKPDFR